MITFDDVENTAGTIIPYLVAPRRGESAESFLKRVGSKAANKYLGKKVMQAGGEWGGSAGAYGAKALLSGLTTYLNTGDAGKALESAAKSTAIKYVGSKVPIAGPLMSIVSSGGGDTSIMDTASSGILGAAGPMGIAAAALPAVVGGVLGNIKSQSIPNRVIFDYDKAANKYAVSFTGDTERMREQYKAMSPESKAKAASIAKAKSDYEGSLRQYSDEEYNQYIKPYLGDYELGDVLDTVALPGGKIGSRSSRVGLSEDDIQTYQTPEFLSKPTDSFIDKREKVSAERVGHYLATTGATDKMKRMDIGKRMGAKGDVTNEEIDFYARGIDTSMGAMNDNTASFINKARERNKPRPGDTRQT